MSSVLFSTLDYFKSLLYIAYILPLSVPVIRLSNTDGTHLFSFHASNVDSGITDLHNALQQISSMDYADNINSYKTQCLLIRLRQQLAF